MPEQHEQADHAVTVPAPELRARERLGAQIRVDVLSRYERRLNDAGSPLLADPGSAARLRRHAEAVVHAVLEDHWRRRDGRPAPLVHPSELDLRGAARAALGEDAHPAESMWAASMLFDVGIEVLGAALPEDGALLALALHRATVVRVVQATAGYVDLVLQQSVHQSRQDERRRLSRELHDHAGHAVRVGIQSLELHALYQRSDPDRAAGKLDVAKEVLLESLDTIRHLAAELRGSVGPGGLDQALRRYLVDNAPPGVRTRVVIAGPVDRLPHSVQEELYLVLRESLQNSLRHARATAIELSIRVADGEVVAEVADDGDGFDPDLERSAPSGLGLTSMRERVELLGGRLELTSASAAGTVVRIQLAPPRSAA